MKLYSIFIAHILLPSILLSETLSSKKNPFHFGFELSELMQNKFSNLGSRNYTFFFGQEFTSDSWKNFGYRFLFINVELSGEHLKDNSFIKGNKFDLEGNLSVSRFFLDWYPTKHNLGFINILPILSIGIGYNRTQIQKGKLAKGISLFQGELWDNYNFFILAFEKPFYLPLLQSENWNEYRLYASNQKYDLKGNTLNLGFRLQIEFWNAVFLEFPVLDTFFYLWRNRNPKGNLETTFIDSPKWGMLFLWINIGYKASF
ncbi:MAG: hypothetical protein N3A69_04100 [Leptospiraceae bacterium]|nr:hypothetical protein [Leptospiraceae bacterium]